MNYAKLGSLDVDAQRRTRVGLRALRSKLDEELPAKNLESTVRIATWNLREFDTDKYNGRLDDAIFYIAEIVSRFDVVAIQEVRRDLDGLERLMEVLGWAHRYIVTDVTEGIRGNQERMAFIYDSRKVRLSGLVGELVLPPLTKRANGKQISIPVSQLARTPFTVGFRAGWTEFQLATVHIFYGKGDQNPERVLEIGQVAGALSRRASDATERNRNLVLLGDFNIAARNHCTMDALTAEGWEVHKAIQRLPGTDARQKKFYDQIAFHHPTRLFEPVRAGVFNFFDVVFRREDELLYAPLMPDSYRKDARGKARNAAGRQRYYRTWWRTFQMSDHLPLWLEVRVDYSGEYLADERGATPGVDATEPEGSIDAFRPASASF